MRFKLLSLLIIFFGLLLAIPVKADTSTRGCETNTMKNGEYCNWAEGKSWNTSNTTVCAVESTTPCPANPSNGTYNFSCNVNSCVLSCNSGYVNCSGTCTAIGSAPNCTNYNTCSGTCTTCAPGYTLSGGTCSAATLKLGSTSVGQSSLLQAGADALAYISGNKMGIGNSNPSANLHINASTDTEGLRIITSNYSPFIIRNAADTADLFRIDQDGNITSLGEITGSNNYWKLNGSDLYASSTSWNLGIGTTNPTQKLDVVGKISLNDGGNSVFVGEGAGLNDDGSDNKNVGVGYQALYSNTTGNGNTANGYQSLYSNTTGYQNTANGHASLRFNTTGSNNTANGFYSLYFNTTGYQNTANGHTSLYSNTTGYQNTANGYEALSSNTTGYQNTANGYTSLRSNTTGSNNTANGYASLRSNTTGYQNTANGYVSLYLNTTGYQNTANGYASLRSNTTGYQNTANGYEAGRYTSTGGENETGNNSLFLGYGTRANADGETNQIVIGSSAIGAGSNSVVLGNNSITKTILKGNVGIGTTSPQSLLDVNGLIKMRTATITADEDVVNKGYLDSAISNNSLWAASASSNIYNINTGNVGIGTTDPASELDVEGTVNSLGMNTLTLIANLADVNTSLDVGSGGASDGIFVNGRAEISGKLGVGMSSPTYPLDVTGNARIGQADNYGLYIGGTQRHLWARASGDLALGTGGADRLTIDSAGNVGIGNTNPGARLQVTGDQVIFSVNQSAGSSGLSINSNLRLGTNTGYAWIQSHGSQPLSINALGNNVGINTTNPAARLEVNGTFKVTGALNSVVMDRLSGTGNRIVMADASGSLYATSSAAATGLPDGSSGQTLRHNGTSWVANSVLFNNGTNVGIGTTNPGAKLVVIGGARIGSASVFPVFIDSASSVMSGKSYPQILSDNGGYGGYGDLILMPRSDGTNKNIRFYSADLERMRITDSGNVGIGTTNPDSRLDVQYGGYGYVGQFIQTDGTLGGANGLLVTSDAESSDIILDLRSSQSPGSTTSNDTKFIVKGDGNVGIGTTNPGTRLTVVGSGSYSIDASNYKIGGVATPTVNTDAANKAYVDSLIINDGSYHSGSDFPDGTLVSTNIPASAASGNSFVIEISGKSYSSSNAPFKVIAQGYLYSSTIINYSGISYGGNFASYIKMFEDGGYLKFWWPRISYWNSFNVHVRNSDGSPVNRVTSITNAVEPTGTKKVQVNLQNTWNSTNSNLSTVNWNANNLYVTGVTAANGGLSQDGNTILNGSDTWLRTTGATGWYSASYGGGWYMTDATWIRNYNNKPLYLNGNGTTAATFMSGNVGIGITNPGTRLTVAGSGNYSIDASSYKIGNVATPTVATDAANKGYVDSAIPASLWSGTLNGNIWNGAAGAGNVGVGTTAPNAKFFVNGTVALGSGNYYGRIYSWNPGSYYSDSPSVIVSGISSATTTELSYPQLVIHNQEGTIGNYSGIGFSAKESNSGGNQVMGAAIMTKFVNKAAGGWVSGDLHFITKNMGTMNDAMVIRYNGSVGIGITNPSSKLHVVGNANITSTLTMGGDINMANNNITAINKLTVNTIDPLYNIKGVNYSTFAPSMVGGVKEEYVGFAKIDQMLKTGEYEKIIDFKQVAEGSDLWVWHNTIDFSPNNVQVIITPIAQFANTYYFIEDDKLVLRADKEVEVSYRLTGNRHDWKEWPTRALDQSEKAGFIID